jgi:transcriptional regulator of acetoin/glycerol metabolism
MIRETLERSAELDPRRAGPPAAPGLIVIFTAGRPATVPVPLDGGAVELGREHAAFAEQPDGRMSRQHARVSFDGSRFVAVDLRSRNGTFVDGAPLSAGAASELSRVLRIGDSLLVPVRDVGPYARFGVRIAGDRVEGPALQAALDAVAQAARVGGVLHVTGETGAGKEGLARAFHAAGPTPGGPLQAVNCATIPETMAERLLFGAKRGAYSGADADADGYAQAAHGGTLFLDEVGELSLPVQAKLLRMLETGEVLPLGAARARRIDLRFCSATHRDLRAQVAAGKLREDLFYRIASPRVAAPPLRDRPEEIPWLLRMEVERVAPGLSLHTSLVEACLLRPWPGNVRELLAEARSAVQAALTDGSARVEGRHLSATAGSAFGAPRGDESAPPSAPGSVPPPTRAQLAQVLRRVEGNISAAARELGVHRTQLRRWMERHGLDPAAFVKAGKAPGEKG